MTSITLFDKIVLINLQHIEIDKYCFMFWCLKPPKRQVAQLSTYICMNKIIKLFKMVF